MTDLTNSEDQAAEPFGEVVTQEPESAVEETPKVVSEPETPAVAEEPAKAEEPVAPVEPVLTDKGTKLDPNPESAAHQLAANAKKEVETYKQLLGDPQRLAEYMKEAFPPKVESTPEKPYTAEDFENLEDVATKFNELQGTFIEKLSSVEKENQQLKDAVSGLLMGGKAQEIYSTAEQDVSTLRNEPELDPKSPDFIEGLEGKIAERFQKLDFDEKTGVWKGQNSLAEIGKEIIDAVRLGTKKGSQRAQTVVKDKTAGKVVTSPKVAEETGEKDLNAGDSIAQGISQTFK